MDEDRLQLVKIEFEQESRNFLKHMHKVDGCDVLVCWKHNWPECPLEVVELRKALSLQQSAFSEKLFAPDERGSKFLTTKDTKEHGGKQEIAETSVTGKSKALTADLRG